MRNIFPVSSVAYFLPQLAWFWNSDKLGHVRVPHGLACVVRVCFLSLKPISKHLLDRDFHIWMAPDIVHKRLNQPTWLPPWNQCHVQIMEEERQVEDSMEEWAWWLVCHGFWTFLQSYDRLSLPDSETLPGAFFPHSFLKAPSNPAIIILSILSALS